MLRGVLSGSGKAQAFFLLFISVVYYAAGGPAFLLYLLFTAISTFVAGKYAAKGNKAAAVISLLLDFGVLAVLKYVPLVVSLLNLLPGAAFPSVSPAFPLGISFYTFQAAGYLLDVYWERCRVETDYLSFLLFISFFPQLMQGPIGRHATLAPQLKEAYPF